MEQWSVYRYIDLVDVECRPPSSPFTFYRALIGPAIKRKLGLRVGPRGSPVVVTTPRESRKGSEGFTDRARNEIYSRCAGKLGPRLPDDPRPTKTRLRGPLASILYQVHRWRRRERGHSRRWTQSRGARFSSQWLCITIPTRNRNNPWSHNSP